MSRLSPTIQEFNKWYGSYPSRRPTVKDFALGVSAPLNNRGSWQQNKPYMKVITDATEFNATIKPLFQDYKRSKPFKPTAVALQNPVKFKQELGLWFHRASEYIKKRQPEQKPWNFKAFPDLGKADKSPRGRFPSSSWLKNLKVRGNEVQITFPHGSKNNPSGVYTYHIDDPKAFERFITNKSMGQIVSRIAALGRADKSDDGRSVAPTGFAAIPSLRK